MVILAKRFPLRPLWQIVLYRINDGINIERYAAAGVFLIVLSCAYFGKLK